MAPLLHPLLFSTFPLLSLFAQNQSEVELSVLWWPLAWCLVATLLIYGALLRVIRRPQKAGALASLLLVAFFYFGLFSDKAAGWGVGDGLQLALWLALVVAGVAAVVRTKRPLNSLTLILSVGAAVLVLPRAVDLAIYHANHPSLSASDPRLWPGPLTPPPRGATAHLPDIYVLIPDDYARPDVLMPAIA